MTTLLPVRDGRQVRRLDGLIGRIRVKFNDGAVGDRLCGRRSSDLPPKPMLREGVEFARESR